jgi:ferric-dicitrate binding protein FerR (iron transport regulator)
MNRDRTWLLVGKKLAGEASAEELQELEGLLRSDPDMHYALQNITDLWNLSSREQHDTEDAFNRHINRLKDAGIEWDEPNDPQQEEPAPLPHKRGTRFHLRKQFMFLGVAVTVLIVAGAWLYWYNAKPKRAASTAPLVAAPVAEKNEISTRNGSKTKITLPDGSKVWLNAGSRLTYNKDFGNTIREVELSGEAFFDVKSISIAGGTGKVPFIIHTPQIDVRVVGTAFNVKSYPGERQTETSLLRGKVKY